MTGRGNSKAKMAADGLMSRDALANFFCVFLCRAFTQCVCVSVFVLN